MWWGPLVLGLCACNQVFGVERTQLLDAPGPIDARPPPSCPSSTNAPVFRNELNQVPVRYCTSYSTSSGSSLAAALCGTYQHSPVQLAVGVPDGPLQTVKVDGLDMAGLTSVRVVPDRDALLVTGYSPPVYTPRFWEIARVDGSWSVVAAHDIPKILSEYSAYFRPTIAGPTRAPDPRLVYVGYDASNNHALSLFELGHAGDSWSVLRSQAIPISGVLAFDEPTLTADGLALVFSSYVPDNTRDAGPSHVRKLFYSRRATLHVPFEPAIELTTVPSEVTSPFLVEDCERIYFSALNTVFYLPY